METTQKKKEDIPVYELKRFLLMITRGPLLEKFQLKKREEEILRLRWVHGFTRQQIAEKYELSEERIKQIADKATRALFYRLERMVDGTFDRPPQPFYKEQELIERLKKENALYKKRFEQLDDNEKMKFRELDLMQKKISDVGLPSRLTDVLHYHHGIVFVGELLNFKKESLLFMKHLSVKNFEDIMKWLEEHNLKLRE